MSETRERRTGGLGRGEGPGRGLRGVGEPLVLLGVPAVLLACAFLQLQATAALTMLVTVVCVALFFASYDASAPSLRQIMPTVVLAAVAAAGRVLFAAFPSVKPVSAIVILAGASLGRRQGFMCGALAALASNLYFGQGAWTPLQMYAWGLVGYLAGVLDDVGALRRPWAVYVWGLASGLLYGAILNSWHVLGFVRPLTAQTALAAFAAGLPLDVAHGVSTAVFLLLIWGPWRSSLARVVRKYDLGGAE